jgi:hypothetical protein
MQLFMPILPQKSNQLKSNTTDALAPLNVIRTETILSRLPIHNPAKRGDVDINITTKNARGETDLHWEISYSKKYGDARQLAYKLDTIVINRKIDGLDRPLPKVIRLGSLRNIGEELELSVGKPIANLRKAFLQNAFVGITAKLRYTSYDGVERSLEAGFTRYSVIFTGERLPDGSKADAVYLILNDPYWEVLNNAPTRPLDYDYLKALKPTAQRFYEIVSFKIYAALRYRHATAKISYSEYCTFSAQQRYKDYDHVKKQMYKVHRQHIKSGYLKKVSCDAVQDSDGNRDWMFYYTPGPKAVAEFKAFNKKHPLNDVAAEDVIDAEASVVVTAANETGDASAQEIVADFYKRFHNVKNPKPQPKELKQAAELIAKHGIEKTRHLVSFSHEAAPETNYKPETFSGILHYQPRADADFEKRQKSNQRITATAQCKLCDRYGQIRMLDAKKAVVMVTCSHNEDHMKDYANSKRYEIS